VDRCGAAAVEAAEVAAVLMSAGASREARVHVFILAASPMRGSVEVAAAMLVLKLMVLIMSDWAMTRIFANCRWCEEVSNGTTG
jgi:hypothetical protein